jgi:hypothetical protein
MSAVWHPISKIRDGRLYNTVKEFSDCTFLIELEERKEESDQTGEGNCSSRLVV